MELSERKKKILASIVEQYIKTGEPVGSNVLLKSLDFSVSSATVRNEMSELSEMGLLEQTHTSSGRVPTHKGYRYYVDELMSERTLDDEQRRRIDMMAGVHFNDPEKLLEAAGEILADITKCAVVSTTPSDSGAKIKKIELIPIAKRTAIVALLTSGGVLKNRVCRTDVELTPEIVETFYRLSAENFVGRTVADIQTAMIQSLVVSFGENSLMLSPIIITVADLAKDVARSEVMLEGQTNLLKNDPTENTYEMLDFLKRSDIVNDLVSSGNDRISLYIGGENPYRQLSNSSMIFSRYDIDGANSGAFGIIGSTRMDYASFLPSIKYLTDIVSDILRRTLEE
ncbi:MAG: heat-inducible transcription repressor HrcA [Clostridia bacterium]|nr:heat-inducible transcription repressor HrcA [Clostridia bacterium]